MGRPTLYSPEMISAYTGKGYWDHTTVADVWDQRALEIPEKEAIIDARKRLTWSEAKQWTDRFAVGLLELGLKKDAVIVLQMPNCAELLLSQIACEKAGVLCIPVPPAFRQREVTYILKTLNITGIIIPPVFHHFDYFEMIEKLRSNLPRLKHVFIIGDAVPSGAISVKEMVERPLDQNHTRDLLETTKFGAFEYSRIQITSGSTGFPKFVEAPICGRIRCAKVYAEACRLGTDDVCGVFTIGPGGPNFISIHSAPLVGAKIVMFERFEAGDALELIDREGITFLGVVPSMLARMIDHADFDQYDLHTIRLVLVTGAPLPANLAERAEEKMGPLIQTYGSMDFGGITAPFIDVPRDVRLFTVNRPIPGNELMVLDDQGSEVAPGDLGEIVVRGPTSTSGFFRDPEATWSKWNRDGWFPTGDLGKIDDNGNLIIVGRHRDIIIRGGQNIYPAEIENLLLSHPKINHVAVVAMPDEIMGEKACACVVPERGHTLSFDDMVNFLKEKKIATYKLPEKLELMDDLPLMPGVPKVDRKELAEQLADRMRPKANP